MSVETDEKQALARARQNAEQEKSTFTFDVGQPANPNYGSMHDAQPKYANDANRKPLSSAGSNSDISDKSTTHCHESLVRHPDSSARARKTLIIASGLCLFFMIVEVVGGYIAGSLAIMTDAAHLLSDFASFMISLVSLYLAARPATRRMSFGWHRAEVIGAVVSVLMIWVLTGILVFVAIQRIIYKDYNIHGAIMLITASVGVAVNLIMAIVLHRGGHGHSHGSSALSDSHGHSHNGHVDRSHTDSPQDSEELIDESIGRTGGNWLSIGAHNQYEPLHGDDAPSRQDNEEPQKGLSKYLPWKRKKTVHSSANINVRAALVHVIGDFVQSIGILIAALIIYYRPDLAVMDPICTFIFSVLVLITTITVMRDALNVLMEGLPRGINFTEVMAALQSINGVIKVHDLRIWSLTMGKVALSVHLAVDERRNSQDILRQATQMLRERFRVFECTVQIEHYSDAMNECKDCETPET